MNFRATTYRLLFPLAKLYWRIFRPKSSGAGCVIQHGNKILLIRHTYGDSSWSFPGGGIKKGESPEIAAVREVREEVGIELKSIEKLNKFVSKKFGENLIHVFYAQTESESFKINPGEILEAKWFSLQEISLGEMSFVGRKMYEIFEATKRSQCLPEGVSEP